MFFNKYKEKKWLRRLYLQHKKQHEKLKLKKHLTDLRESVKRKKIAYLTTSNLY